MKYLNKKTFIYLSILCVFSSCRKYNDPWGCKDCPRVSNECECVNYPNIKYTYTGPTLGGQIPESYRNNTFQINYTQINPSNSNQIAFSERYFSDSTNSFWRLVLFDIESRSKTYLSDIIGIELGYVHYAWDNKNNLYFSFKSNDSAGMSRINTVTGKIEKKLFKGLKFTKGMSWIESTQRIGFEGYGGYNSRYYLMLDFETGGLDTLEGYLDDFYFHYYYVKFSKDLYFTGLNEPKKAITYHKVNSPDSGILARKWQLIGDGEDYNVSRIAYSWHPNRNALYMVNQYIGIHYSSVNKHNVIRVKKYCDNIRYHEISISNDGRHIIALRAKYEYTSDSPIGSYDGWLYRQDEIVRMDIDGCNEEVIYKGY